MPWRKRYDPDASLEEKGQRAYEVGRALAWELTKDLGVGGHVAANSSRDCHFLLESMDGEMAHDSRLGSG